MIRTKLICTATIAALTLLFACGSSTTTPTAPVPSANPYGAYYGPPPCDPSQPGCVPGAQPAYPAQPQPGYPAQPQPAYPAPAPATASTMAVPGPLALPCQSDSACIMGRCNTQYQKCAFPCQSAADCAAGASCNAMSGLCLPGG